MAIERYEPDRADIVVFSFLTKEEGRDALKMAVDLIAGECGDFTFLPPAIKSDDIMAQRGYLGFSIRGDTNALSRLTIPKIRECLMEGLGILDEQLRNILSPHLHRHGWVKKPPNAMLTGAAQ